MNYKGVFMKSWIKKKVRILEMERKMKDLEDILNPSYIKDKKQKMVIK